MPQNAALQLCSLRIELLRLLRREVEASLPEPS